MIIGMHAKRQYGEPTRPRHDCDILVHSVQYCSDIIIGTGEHCGTEGGGLDPSYHILRGKLLHKSNVGVCN